jgi:predicted flap endonuclease-1-like 5' DNA nuclease
MEQLQIGPAGGNGGRPFEHYDVPLGSRLTAIHVYTEWVVNAIQIDFANAAGGDDGRPPIGGLGGEHHVFYLDEGEYLTGLSGRAGWYIDSIRFHTNRRVSTTFGGGGGDREYHFEAPEGHEIVGFFGRSEWYIDSLGVYVRRHEAEATPRDMASGDGGQTWTEMADEGQALPASVVVKRTVVASNEALEELEDVALAEAIAGLGGEEIDEGQVDAALYTQVLEDGEAGQTVAIVLAVAAEAGVETVGDDPDEAAVMVSGVVESDDDMASLEDEAVAGAIDLLLEDVEGEVDEVEVTIYAGVSEDEAADTSYGAVVAIATRIGAIEEPATRGAAQPAAGARQPRPKDLERVEGIGPKIAELLIAHDIFDLAELAETSVERLRTILGGAGRRFRLAEPASWPEQARLGASGLWDALTELQSRLRAGR